jgi:hypothetical protein
MEQSLHLLIVDRERGDALVTWHGSRWLLPIVRMPERMRAGPVLLQWAAERGVTGDVVGQWVGRAAPEKGAIDWLVVMDATGEPRAAPPSNSQSTRLAELRSATSCVDYQRWAVANVLSTSDLPAVLGPFGNMTWPQDVHAWVDGVAGALHGGTNDVVAYRTTAYDVVLGLRTARGLVYFKGLSADRAPEARMSAQLAEIAADAFPRTIAVSKRPDGSVWWLMEACPGSPLAASATCAGAAHVAAAYAAVQQQCARAIADGDLGELTPLALGAMAVWAADVLDRTDERPQRVSCAAAIKRACERVSVPCIPRSWICADLDPTNVLMHGDEVRFIDVDDSALGPAPIAMATFATRLKRLGISCGSDLYRSYERAWKPQVVMRDLWRDFEIVSTLVDCHLAWKRVVVKTERQEIHGCLGLARDTLARRLARVVAADAP